MSSFEERDAMTYAIIGAAMEVHKELGPGFLEAVYQDAMEIELKLRGIPSLREPALPVYYKDILLPRKYSPDFLCYENIVVELKAHNIPITKADRAQLVNYLKVTRLRRGLLFNFGLPSLAYERVVYGYEKQTP